ncbi:MAG: DMT family transporter [Candidatus Doudnabacteria bacterium]|nr:DMT family transporter [Candidatus Doudnabacteria bacterium]
MKKYMVGPWLVTLAALLWAIDAPFRKYLTTDLSSTTIVLMEHIVIVILALPLMAMHVYELKNLAWKEWLAVAFVGFGGSALATVFFTQSFHYLNPTVAILLQKLQPLIAISLAAWVLKETLSKKFWFWAIIALIGAYIISFPDFKPEGFTWNNNMLGVILAVAAAFLWGGSTVFGRFVLRKSSFQLMTALRFFSALLFLILINIYYGTLNQVSTATGKDWLFVLIIAVIAGFVSLMIYYYGLQSTKASIATLCELAFPFAAVIVNWIFLDAALSLMQIFGGLVLLFAITKLTLVNQEQPNVEGI